MYQYSFLQYNIVLSADTVVCRSVVLLLLGDEYLGKSFERSIRTDHHLTVRINSSELMKNWMLRKVKKHLKKDKVGWFSGLASRSSCSKFLLIFSLREKQPLCWLPGTSPFIVYNDNAKCHGVSAKVGCDYSFHQPPLNLQEKQCLFSIGPRLCAIKLKSPQSCWDNFFIIVM